MNAGHYNVGILQLIKLKGKIASGSSEFIESNAGQRAQRLESLCYSLEYERPYIVRIVRQSAGLSVARGRGAHSRIYEGFTTVFAPCLAQYCTVSTF